uniref:Acid phosphatase n=1 Tax=Oryza nivara TaxID=4536 RepID=A0A0E0HAM4_ORYNI
MATARLLLLLTVVAAAAGSCFCSGQEAKPPTPPPPPPYCGSVRTAVEAHNIIGWKTFPADCAKYVADYITGDRYGRDSDVVINEAVAYAESLKLSGSGKEVWVFDVDETALSTVPYQAKHGYGVQPYDHANFLQYVAGGSAPALQGTLRLYQRLLQLGIKPVFLTDRTEDQIAITTHNLLSQGYSSWEKLLLQPIGLQTSTQAFKTSERKKLVDAGYIIIGNIGDQWSDILGSPEGCRTFKYPNPMYYVA